MIRTRIAYIRLTSCSGCQLTLLNCEEELARVGELFEPVRFEMLSSAADDGGPLAAVLVEGSAARPEEVQRLLDLRRRSRWLVAIGACALSGGVNRLVDDRQGEHCAAVYDGVCTGRNMFPPQSIDHFVAVDLCIPGCPPEPQEILGALLALQRGTLPGFLREHAVCMECRQRENLCLLLERKLPCLGPVTRGGCNARCPSIGIVCEGCRGYADQPAREEQAHLLRDLGLSERQVRERMGRFTGGNHETP